MKCPPRLYPSLALFAALCPIADALTWSFTSEPTQCGQLTADWSGGTGPFTLLLVPTGHLTPETRTILQEDVSSGDSVSFQLNYPANSTFVAVLNDATGIGAGGTSVVITVGDSSDTSCLNTQEVSPEFTFSLPDSIGQCDSVDITFDSGAESFVNIIGLIPGGQSFEITNITDLSTTSFDWTADVRSGSDVVFVAGDKNGLGKGGSSDVMSIGSGSNDDCIKNSSPSSTTGSAAGGVSSTAQSSGSGDSSGTAATQTGQLTTTDNAGSTVTVNQPSTLTTTDSAGHTVTVTAGQASLTTTDSAGHTTTIAGIPVTTTDNSGSTVTIGGTSFPGSGGGTVTGSSAPGSDDSSKNHLPLILGLVFGLLALLGLLIGAYILYRRRRAHKYQNLEKGADEDAQPWFARGAHLRGGANSSISTLPELYQTEPFILPTEPQSYYNYSPVPTPGLSHFDPYQQQHISTLIRPHHMNSTRSTHSFADNAPSGSPAVGYGTRTSSDSKLSASASVGPHGRPVSRTPSGTAIPPRPGPGMPPVSSPDPPTRVSRDAEDSSHEEEEDLASPNPFEDTVVDIPPTYASARRASTRRSLDHSSSSLAGPWGPRSLNERVMPVRPGGTLHRSNASRRSIRSEIEGYFPQQGSQGHDHGESSW